MKKNLLESRYLCWYIENNYRFMLPFLCVLKSSMEHICIYIYENLMQRGSVNAVLKVEHAIKTEAANTHDDDDMMMHLEMYVFINY